MKIQSRFRDYYDYVAHQYGGGDPKITYVREPLTELNDSGFRPSITVNHKLDLHVPDKRGWNNRFAGYNFKVLVIMDRAFLTIEDCACPSLDKVYNFSFEHKIYDFETNPLKLQDKRFLWSDGNINYPRGQASKEVLELTKKVGAPVYMIEAIGRENVYIQSEIPQLGKLGIPAVYSAEQLYQDMSYFMGNTIYDNPDINPPVSIDDKTRLMQHGFDIKQSFRHRK